MLWGFQYLWLKILSIRADALTHTHIYVETEIYFKYVLCLENMYNEDLYVIFIYIYKENSCTARAIKTSELLLNMIE